MVCRWFFKSKGEWEDGDPSGIRARDALLGSSDVPKCTDFKPEVPFNDNGILNEYNSTVCDANGSCASEQKRQTLTGGRSDDSESPSGADQYNYANSNKIYPMFALTFDTISAIRKQLSGRGDTEVPLYDLNPDQNIEGLTRQSLRAPADVLIAPLIFANVSKASTPDLNSKIGQLRVEMDLGEYPVRIHEGDAIYGPTVTKSVPRDCDDFPSLRSIQGIDGQCEHQGTNCLFSDINPYFSPLIGTDHSNVRLCHLLNYIYGDRLVRQPGYELPERNREITYSTPIPSSVTQEVKEQSIDVDDYICRIKQEPQPVPSTFTTSLFKSTLKSTLFVGQVHLREYPFYVIDKIYCGDDIDGLIKLFKKSGDTECYNRDENDEFWCNENVECGEEMLEPGYLCSCFHLLCKQ